MTVTVGGITLSARVVELVELLRRNGHRADVDGTVPQENTDALAEAGMFRIIAPTRYGGQQVGVRDFLEIIAELGHGCGSTAWLASLTNASAWTVGLFPEQAQREVFDVDSDALLCPVLVPGGAGVYIERGQVITERGQVLTGRWVLAAGAARADWAILGVGVVDASGESLDPGLALVPMAELVMKDMGDATGMRGAGNHALVAEEIFVPEHRIISITKAIHGLYQSVPLMESLFRSAFVPVWSLACAGPQLGLARCALDTVRDLLAWDNRAAPLPRGRIVSPPTLSRFAEAAALIDSAELHLLRAADDVDRWAVSTNHMPQRARARARMDSAHAVRSLREAVGILLDIHGPAGIAEIDLLARIGRDLETAGRHPLVDSSVAEQLYGRTLLTAEDQLTHLV